MPAERPIDEGPYGDLPATGAGNTDFGAVDDPAYRQPQTDPLPPDDDAGASGSPGHEATGSTSGLRDGQSADFDATAGSTAADTDEGPAGTPNADRAHEVTRGDTAGASTPATPGF